MSCISVLYYLNLQEQAERLDKEINNMAHYRKHDIEAKREKLHQVEQNLLKIGRMLGV